MPIDDESTQGSQISKELKLHNSDHPNYVLATTLLNERNYGHWRRSVEVSLRAKNKIGMVTGTCKKPDDKSPDAEQWEVVNNMVISWLLHSVEKDIVESVIFCRTASRIWKELETRFHKPNRTRVFHVQCELSSLSQGSSSVSTYFTKFKRLWDEYMLLLEDCVCACGSNKILNKVMTDQQVVQFLMGLNESFSTVRGSILLMNPPPSLDEVYQLILQEEDQRQSHVSFKQDQDALALATQRGGPKDASKGTSRGQPRYCDHCKTGGHSIDRCWKLHGKPGESGSLFCDHCKISGHVIEKCWKIHGYPTKQATEHKFFCDHCKIPGHSTERCWKLHGYPPGKGVRVAAQASTGDNLEFCSSETSHAAFLAGKCFSFFSSSISSSWILDSGASDHITPNLNLFQTYVTVPKPVFITLPDGQKSVVHHIGTIHLSEHIILHNVLHVPAFHFNLLSVNKLTKDMSTNVIFTPTSCLLQAPLMNKQLLIGHEVNGLYVIDKSSSIKLVDNVSESSHLSSSVTNNCPILSCNVSISQISPELWHCRLGHISFDQLQHIMISGSSKSDYICKTTDMDKG
ncbi:hypothetical protein V2J09_013482 [Rumex salicifolius]